MTAAKAATATALPHNRWMHGGVVRYTINSAPIGTGLYAAMSPEQRQTWNLSKKRALK
jgi:hypothetical protein